MLGKSTSPTSGKQPLLAAAASGAGAGASPPPVDTAKLTSLAAECASGGGKAEAVQVLETAAHHGTLELLGEGGGALTESVVVEQREQQLLLRGGGPCPWHEQISVLANFG